MKRLRDLRDNQATETWELRTSTMVKRDRGLDMMREKEMRSMRKKEMMRKRRKMREIMKKSPREDYCPLFKLHLVGGVQLQVELAIGFELEVSVFVYFIYF